MTAGKVSREHDVCPANQNLRRTYSLTTMAAAMDYLPSTCSSAELVEAELITDGVAARLNFF